MAGVNRAPSVALLTSSVDLGEPGKLGPFIDERSIALAEQGTKIWATSEASNALLSVRRN